MTSRRNTFACCETIHLKEELVKAENKLGIVSQSVPNTQAAILAVEETKQSLQNLEFRTERTMRLDMTILGHRAEILEKNAENSFAKVEKPKPRKISLVEGTEALLKVQKSFMDKIEAVSPSFTRKVMNKFMD